MSSRRRDRRRTEEGRSPHSTPHPPAETTRSSNDKKPAQEIDKPDSVGLERLIFFSDAVFAIAITLLVIDLHLPTDAGSDLLGALRDLIPNFEGFAISFFVIALYWSVHHRMFRYIRDYDGRMLWLNNFLLMSIVFLPFSTTLINEYGDQATAVIFYALNLVVIGVFFLLLWIHAAYRAKLIDPATPAGTVRQATRNLLIVPVVFLASIPLALFKPGDATYSWLLIPVLLRLVADRRSA
ncbi:MAG TPA: TMEM175 family protein [Nitrolancea sp.]|nr:TMEM175 family protein [Nitrolancea sp.]